MPYTKVFNKPYADGYKDRPDLSTPETAANLNAKDNALEHIEEYLLNQKTSDLQNDSGFVNNNDVSEAIKGKADKSTTYTKTEVDELVPDNKELLEDLSDSEGKLAYKGEVIGGGGNANERELTYAEYQALSEEEKMNGTNYFVKDYPSGSGGGGGSSMHEYSTEEKVVGTWIDGKPLYERTWYVDNPDMYNKAYTMPNSVINDVDYIVNMQTVALTTNGEFIPVPFANATNQQIWQFYTTTGLTYYSHLGAISKITTTVQYTKTTD